MRCLSCGHENPTGSKFCSECGAPSAAPGMCPACGFANASTAKFCNECGAPLASGPAGARSAVPSTVHPASFAGGRYQVKQPLGEGAKKRVYLAHDARLDRDVAFALIKADGLDDEGLRRIRREAQAMGRLGDHPNVVPVYDIGEEDGTPFLVTQFMGGGDLEGLIAGSPERRLPLPDAIRIADEICQALEHAHQHGIVHRDLKPGNVWLTASLQPLTPTPQPLVAKLGDFGLAVSLDRSRLTQAGMMVGTVAYMSPEQAMGGAVEPRSDLYSLGAMLYEMVTGRPPFLGDESVAIINQHLNTPPVAPAWHNPDVPAGLEALILRLLEKDPAKRPISACEVRQALATARTEDSVLRTEGPSPRTQSSVLSPPVIPSTAAPSSVGRESCASFRLPSTPPSQAREA